MDTEIRQLALFKLDIVPLPGELVPLHVFEPRYQALVSHCLGTNEQATHQPFGIGKHRSPSSLGTLMKIEQLLEQFPDGRSLILALAVGRYRLLSEDNEHDFPSGKVEVVSDLKMNAIAAEPLRNSCISKTQELLNVFQQQVEEENFLSPLLSFAIAVLLQFDTSERAALLCLQSEDERLQFVNKLLDFRIAVAKSANLRDMDDVIEQ